MVRPKLEAESAAAYSALFSAIVSSDLSEPFAPNSGQVTFI